MPTTTAKDQRTVTLEQFSAQIDAHLGRPAGFAEAVAALAEARARTKRVDDRRKAIYRELEQRHLGRGGGVVVLPGGGGREPWVLRRTEEKRSVVRTVPAELVKKLDRAAYERARVSKAKLKLVTPETWRGGGDVDRLPAIPHPTQTTDHVINLYRSKVFDVLRDLKAEEEQARLDLDKIAADCGWDGGEAEGPLAFTDGWMLGLRTREYSVEALKANQPEVFDRLAISKERRSGTRLMVMGLDQAMALGFVTEDDLECDEIDGE